MMGKYTIFSSSLYTHATGYQGTGKLNAIFSQREKHCVFIERILVYVFPTQVWAVCVVTYHDSDQLCTYMAVQMYMYTLFSQKPNTNLLILSLRYYQYTCVDHVDTACQYMYMYSCVDTFWKSVWYNVWLTFFISHLGSIWQEYIPGNTQTILTDPPIISPTRGREEIADYLN